MGTVNSRVKILSEQLVPDDYPVDDSRIAQMEKNVTELQTAVRSLIVHANAQQQETAKNADTANSNLETILALLARATQVLTERVAIALGVGLLPLLAILGGIVLWRDTMQSPNEYQLVGLGLCGVLIVLPTLVHRRKA